VFRVSARLGLTKNAKNPLQTEMQLVKYPKKKFPLHIIGLSCMDDIHALREILNRRVRAAALCEYYNRVVVKKKAKDSLLAGD